MPDGYERLEKRAEHTAGDFADRPARTTLKWAAGIALIVLAITALVGVVTAGSPFFDAFKARATAGARVTTKVYDPNNIIGQVQFFTQTCEDVGRDYANWKTNQAAYRRQLDLAKTASNAGDQVQAQQAAEQLANYVSGAETQLQADSAYYNARSINYTANPFKTAGLPARITPPADPTQLSDWTPPSCG